MKKALCILLVSVMVLCAFLTACGENEKRDVAGGVDDEKNGALVFEGAVDDLAEADMSASGSAYGSGGSEGNSSEGDVEILPGTLTCGEWNDNRNFAFFRSVFEREEWSTLADKMGMKPTTRFRVTLSNGQTAGKNVLCSLYGGDTYLGGCVTDASGEAYIYYNVSGKDGALPVPDTLVVGDIGYPVGEKELAEGGIAIDTLDGIKYDAADIMFVVDTTGSMSDELDYLKKELADVVERVTRDNNGLAVRVGLVFYRDEGDEYVTRVFDFDGDIKEVCKNLDAQFSDGGGDFPEAVDVALGCAIGGEGIHWREDAVKLVFFVADAPEHDGAEADILSSLHDATITGKRIIPVVSSGADTQTELLFRTMAAVTGGTYVFLTDDSGVGDAHLEPTIGDYDVKMLNDMLVNIINGYCR